MEKIIKGVDRSKDAKGLEMKRLFWIIFKGSMLSQVFLKVEGRSWRKPISVIPCEKDTPAGTAGIAGFEDGSKQ